MISIISSLLITSNSIKEEPRGPAEQVSLNHDPLELFIKNRDFQIITLQKLTPAEIQDNLKVLDKIHPAIIKASSNSPSMNFDLKKKKILDKNTLAAEKIKFLSEAIHLHDQGRLSSKDFFALKPLHQIVFMKQEMQENTKIKPATRKFVNSACEKISSQIQQILERSLLPKPIPSLPQTKSNPARLAKWKHAGQDASVCLQFPSFVQFLEDFKILPYLKISRDRVGMLKGEPVLFVEGKPLNEAQLRERFEITYCKRFAQHFIKEKASGETYTYLDNGLGLEPFHPYLTPLKRPISTIHEADYLKVLESAQKFKRPEENPEALPEKREHVVQIVSSKLHGLQNNAFNLLMNAKHPWFRYIRWNPETRQGEVFEAGFGWEKSPTYSPLATSPGAFRAPDMWEFIGTKSRVVTNIPASSEELENFISFLQGNIQKALNQEIGFQLDRHNCTALIAVGSEQLNVPVSTKMNLSDMVWTCSPNLWQSSWTLLGGKHLKAIPGVTATSNLAGRLLANSVRYLGGAGRGEKKLSLHSSTLTPDFNRWSDFLSDENFWWFLPGVLQQWQLEQESTVEFPNPVKLTIVPPQPV